MPKIEFHYANTKKNQLNAIDMVISVRNVDHIDFSKFMFTETVKN